MILLAQKRKKVEGVPSGSMGFKLPSGGGEENKQESKKAFNPLPPRINVGPPFNRGSAKLLQLYTRGVFKIELNQGE